MLCWVDKRWCQQDNSAASRRARVIWLELQQDEQKIKETSGKHRRVNDWLRLGFEFGGLVELGLVKKKIWY